MAMSTFYFYDAADFIGSKKDVKRFVETTPDAQQEDLAIVQKSARRWAVFSPPGSYLIPSYEPTYTAKEVS